jgi:hypothetical protein
MVISSQMIQRNGDFLKLSDTQSTDTEKRGYWIFLAQFIRQQGRKVLFMSGKFDLSIW